MKITVAHSPDSDDAFMFYGLASGAVETNGISVEHLLADIETLNRAAFDGRYEVTAVSFHAYAHLTDKYLLLRHGASMGDRYGPVVVTKPDGPRSLQNLTDHPNGHPTAQSLRGGGPGAAAAFGSHARLPRVGPALGAPVVAVPGLLTTAYLALKLYAPKVEVNVMPFDQIQEAVHDGKAGAGLLIHEGQLTYGNEGLRKLVDLGEWWAEKTGGLPLPLGGNVIRRDLGAENIAKISRLLHDSIVYGLSHREEALTYAMKYGRGLDRTKADEFVGMYVNDLTLDYGDRGRAAVQLLLDEAAAARLIPSKVTVEFAPEI